MKLFKSLLVAPATLGLLAPLSATANELNLNDVSGYSSSEEIQNINEFNPAEELAVTNSRVDGLEARFNDFEAAGFSETTTASFGSNFYVGAVDGGTTTVGTTTGVASEAVTFSYDFNIGLSTSFTGDDSFDIDIDAGNAGSTAVDDFMGGDATNSDQLQLDGVSYTFPLGDATVIVGDGVGVDDLNTGACAYSAFTDLVSDCAANEIGGSADSAIAIGYDFGNGFTMAGGIGGGTGVDGYFTDEDTSTIGLEAAYTADTYGVAVAYTDDEATTYWTLNAMLAPEGYPSISVGYETDDNDADAFFAGLTFSDVGPGSVSLGMASTATAATDFYQYELSYEYPLNDGVTITPGVFIAETAAEDDTGFVVKTSFSF
jgi:hypothetical protein